jgi:ribosome-associated toxin RatA of RatAB toxin-antitoxin module
MQRAHESRGEIMSHLATSIRIEAPPAAVFDLVADPARSPEWQTLLVEMGDIAGRPGGIGSSFVGFYRVAGRKLACRFVVTAAERPRIFQVNGTTTGGWARWTTMIEPDGPASTVSVKLEYELPGEIVGSLFGLLTGNRVEREFRRTYDNLRQRIETGVAATLPRPVDPALTLSHEARDDDDMAGSSGQLATT